MSIKRRGLGRNLDALLGGARMTSQHTAVPLPDSHLARIADPVISSLPSAEGLVNLPIDQIKPGQYQPRKAFAEEALRELADSIQSRGLISPITVRKQAGQNHYELIAGERRWRAALLAGLERIPALVKDLNDEDALAIALIENIQREDLNPLEEAMALKRLLDEFSMTHQEIAEAVGKSRSSVSNLLRLMELPDTVKQLLENGDLEMGHARALLALTSVDERIQAARQVAAKALSVRETERLVKTLLSPKVSEKPVKKDVNVQHLMHTLADKLAAKVIIQHAATGKGKLIIQYNSLDELDGIISHIK
ncbi:MAG: chromosome partitioning protein ParB [Gammaproteobacteria bacterium]|jgi:ParB family chromosome partitioning protein|nr:chromosome partitioning protein ParB [Gammaproteobacteria bacterium]